MTNHVFKEKIAEWVKMTLFTTIRCYSLKNIILLD